MKVKLNLSGDGIKQFFFHNGEKIVLGLTALILLGFLYSAFTAKPIDDSKSPESIRTVSRQVESRIKEPGPPPEDQFGVTDFTGQVKKGREPVSVAAVSIPKEWNPPVFPELSPRADPEFYPAAELQVFSGKGIVPYNPSPDAVAAPIAGFVPQSPGIGLARPRGREEDLDNGRYNNPRQPVPAAALATDATIAGVHAMNAESKAKYWAVITALVPVDKQADEYRRKFEYALPGGIVDVPRYFRFDVQRTEVKDEKDTNYNWGDPLKYKDLVEEITHWATRSPELADPQYVFPPEPVPSLNLNAYLTWPLPPLYLKNWGHDAVHPKVPLMKLQEVQSTTQTNQIGQGDIDAAGLNPAVGAMQPGGQNPAMLNVAGAGPVAPAVSNKLFRFVDLSAEPGKTYRYRVQLVLYNPNYVSPNPAVSATTLQERHLAKKESGRSPWTKAVWSEPSAAVTIPREFRILAESTAVTPGVKEPKAKIEVQTMIKTGPDPTLVAASATGAPARDVWLEVVKDTELLLGSVAYLADATIEKVPDMTIEQIRAKVEKVTIETNQSMLLDVRNDDPLAINGKSKTTPVEMLFIDATGRLSVANSGADSLALKEFKDRTTLPTDVPGVIPNNGAPVVTPPKVVVPAPAPGVTPRPAPTPAPIQRVRPRDLPGAG